MPVTSTVPDPGPGDDVECTVFAPLTVAAPGNLLVQVFAHLVEQAGAARALAVEFDADAERRAIKSLAATIPWGTVVHFDLSIPPLKVDEPVESLVWRGRPEAVQFAVRVPAGCPSGTVIGTVGVSVASVPIGRVRFRLTVTDATSAPPASAPPASAPAVPTGDEALRYRTAFVSYASADRAKVVARLQMLSVAGISYFQDIDMEPGERWERALYRQMDDCDLFLLFWSDAARSSEWVRKEVAYALERGQVDDRQRPHIRPVIIEGPPFVPPWEELSHLHFNDKLLYVLAGEKGTPESPSGL